MRGAVFLVGLFAAEALQIQMSVSPKKVVVLGGTGYVGREVCRLAVKRGHTVTSLSRRGQPEKGRELDGVKWLSGDATDPTVIANAINGCDVVVHSLGLLFDITTPWSGALNLIVSGSKSKPGPGSTYDAITRATAFSAIDALRRRPKPFALPFANKAPQPATFAFVSCAEAGWPDVKFGTTVEGLAPDGLKRYLAAKRAVEGELQSAADSGVLRPIIYRPSLIWDWSKLDVLPIIPIFNIASALGVPFVDTTVRVETLAAAIVAGFESDSETGVKRFTEIEELASAISK